MTLADLYPRGTKLADVPGHFRGMGLRQYEMLDIERQCEEYRRSIRVAPEEAPISRKRVWSKRDSYGWRSA